MYILHWMEKTLSSKKRIGWQCGYRIHNVEAIVAFNYVGASPALMRKCNENNVNLSFFHNDSFCARMIGQENGNVVLRKIQYRLSEREDESLTIARNMILGKGT